MLVHKMCKFEESKIILSMKITVNILRIVVLIFFNINAFSQIEKCGTMYVLEQHQKTNPSLKERIQKVQKTAKLWENTDQDKKSSNIVIIPVVVHVVYNVDSAQQNIPDSVIYSQIEVLNEDYRRLNADTVNTRSIFDTIAADIDVEFCLATIDPDGNTTNGITRTVTTVTDFDILTMMDSMKFTSSGGQDAWPSDQYLNIWVCNMTIFGMPGLLGYAQFPGDNPATDGVVIQYPYFGRTNDPNSAAESKGRTTSHEVGHWLGLYHIWGNTSFLGGSCDSIDYVDDTPNAFDQSNSDCNLAINSCSVEHPYWSTTDPPDMVENYMDYSTDLCMNSFTHGQKNRMLSFLNTDRVSLLTSNGCDTTTGIIQYSLSDNQVKIYPNPSSGELKITINKTLQNVEIKIINVLGQLVVDVKNSNGQQVPFQFDMSDNPAGVYFVKITSRDSSTVKKFVLQK